MSPSSRLGPLLGRIITVGCWCWYLFTRAAAARLLRKNSLLTPGQSAHHLSAAGGRLVLAVARPWRVWTKIKKITRTFLLHSLLSPAQRSLSLNVNLQNSSSGQHKMCCLKISGKKIKMFRTLHILECWAKILISKSRFICGVFESICEVSRENRKVAIQSLFCINPVWIKDSPRPRSKLSETLAKQKPVLVKIFGWRKIFIFCMLSCSAGWCLYFKTFIFPVMRVRCQPRLSTGGSFRDFRI